MVNQLQEAYDGLGQLATEYQEHGGSVNTSTSLKVQYTYSEMPSGANHSRPVSMTYPNGRVLDDVYNTGLDTAVSRISGLKDDNTGTHVEDYAYLGSRTLVQRSHPEPTITLDLWGGTSGTYAGLDNFDRVIDQKWTGPSSSITDDFQYGYDRDSGALYKNNTVVSALSELYHANSGSSGDNSTAYDNLSRLVGFRRGTLSSSGNNGAGLDTITTSSLSSHMESWTLDALGNWPSQTIDGTATSRTHNSKNELTAVSSNNLTFDSNGNTTTDQAGNTLKYDAWNRLISMTTSGSVVLASYIYDAKGWRVKETHSSTTTDLYFSNKWQVIEERQSSTVTNQYVWSLAYVDDLILRDDNSTSGSLGISGSGLGRRLYAQQDDNWNVTTLVNTSGAVQERFVYDPYGNALVLTSGGAATTDAYNWNYLHQGGRLDGATGLYVFRYRDYSPTLGRFIQNDPSGYVYGISMYQYLASQPIGSCDPYGLCPCDDLRKQLDDDNQKLDDLQNQLNNIGNAINNILNAYPNSWDLLGYGMGTAVSWATSATYVNDTRNRYEAMTGVLAPTNRISGTFAVIGIGLDTISTVQAYRSGDTDEAISSGSSLALGAWSLLYPPAAVAAAIGNIAKGTIQAYTESTIFQFNMEQARENLQHLSDEYQSNQAMTQQTVESMQKTMQDLNNNNCF